MCYFLTTPFSNHVNWLLFELNDSFLFCRMVQKKIDSRVRTLIENGVKQNQRTLMIIIGDNGKDQVFPIRF